MSEYEDDYRLNKELLPIMIDLRIRNSKRQPLTSVAPELMRQRASDEFVPWNENPPQIESVRDFEIDAGSHKIPVRFYDPNPSVKTGLLIYFHGGGWIIGDLELEDGALRSLAKEGEFKVLSVDYRLAPEFMFPAAIEDGETVMEWVQNNYESLNISPAHVGFGGGSAGANVAMGSLLRLRDNNKAMPIHIALLYGAFLRGGLNPSLSDFANGRFGLPKIAMDFFWNSYLGDMPDHPHAQPLLADLKNLPSCFIMECELDILASESAAIAKKLIQSGVNVNYKIYKGAMHGYTQYFKASKFANDTLKETANIIKNAIKI